MSWFQIFLLLLIACGMAYTLIACWSVWRFFSSGRENKRPFLLPPVSILKPLKGSDPGLRENLDSFCNQDYPAYEVLLGFTDPRDGAMDTARSIAGKYPDRVRIVVSPAFRAANRKVANLAGLVSEARHRLVVFSDSDMRADPSYLAGIVREYYLNRGTGLVTSLYKISSPESVGAGFESLSIALDFIPMVLVAMKMEGISFGLGASMLTDKSILAGIGGVASVSDYLADDYQIGNRIWKNGHTIVLSRFAVEDVAGPMTMTEFLVHQIRWTRTYRVCRPGGYTGLGVTYVFFLSVLFLVVSGPTPAGLAAILLALALRLALALVVYKKVMRSRRWLKWLALMPVKDVLGFGIWISAFLGKRISWRGRKYRIEKSGLLTEID